MNQCTYVSFYFPLCIHRDTHSDKGQIKQCSKLKVGRLFKCFIGKAVMSYMRDLSSIQASFYVLVHSWLVFSSEEGKKTPRFSLI